MLHYYGELKRCSFHTCVGLNAGVFILFLTLKKSNFYYGPNQLKILWTFSIYLESVAILPQLFMISKTGEAETITSHYLFALGAYRALYIVNWIYRYYFEGFYDFIAIVAGCVQTALYCDFFYLYITKGNDKLQHTYYGYIFQGLAYNCDHLAVWTVDEGVGVAIQSSHTQVCHLAAAVQLNLLLVMLISTPWLLHFDWFCTHLFVGLYWHVIT